MSTTDAPSLATNLENIAATIAAETSALLQRTSQESRSAYSSATQAQANMASIAGAQGQAIAAATTKASELRAQGFAEASRIADADVDQLPARAVAALKATEAVW